MKKVFVEFKRTVVNTLGVEESVYPYISMPFVENDIDDTVTFKLTKEALSDLIDIINRPDNAGVKASIREE